MFFSLYYQPLFFLSPVAEASDEQDAASLKDSEAPLTLVCTETPEATDNVKYCLLKTAFSSE